MKNRSIKNSLYCVLGAFLWLVISFCNAGKADAAVNTYRSIVDKAIYQGVSRCYANGMIVDSMDLKNYKRSSTIVTDNASEYYIPLISGGGGGFMDRVVNTGSVRYKIPGDKLSCDYLFNGNDGVSSNNPSLLAATGHDAPDQQASDSTEQIVKFFENMGYEVTKQGGGGNCYQATYHFISNGKEQEGTAKTLNRICESHERGLFVEGLGEDATVETSSTISFVVKSGRNICIKAYGEEPTQCAHLGGSLNEGSLTEAIQSACRSGGVKGKCSASSIVPMYVVLDSVAPDSGTESLSNYSAKFLTEVPEKFKTNRTDLSPKGIAGYVAIEYLSNGDFGFTNSIAYDKPEKRILYQEYLTEYYGYKIECSDARTSTHGKIQWFDTASGEIRECGIEELGTENTGKVNGINSVGFLAEGSIDASGIIDVLNSETNYTDEEMEKFRALVTGGKEDTGEGGLNDCRNSGVGKNLGYLLCTILELAGEAVKGMYEDHIGPALSTKTELFTGGNASEQQVPYQAWQQFRDIANMIFVVLLLVVIFSQLTGVGIDNYGIKRILPKLILSVVLINMSYLICMIAIDISNIVGNGVQALFENLGKGLTDTIDVEGNSVGATGGLVSFGLAGGLAVMVGSVWASPMILLSLLPTVLGALVAVFFLFFLVSARQAAIVVLVVMSPLAVACSVLPNTKTIFSKYLKMFEGLLLVYPITSALVSGGDYVSRLILQIGGGNNFSLALTSMVVGIIPIFFIPSMIKDSFAALGKIGGTVAGFGKTLGGTTGKAVQSSDLFKNSQAAAAERSARIKGGFDRNGNPVRGRRRTIANILSGGTMGRQRNALQYQQMVAKRGSLAAADEEDFMLQTDTENELKRITASGEINNNGLMRQRLFEALQSNDPGSRARIRAYTDALSTQGEAGHTAVKRAYNDAVQTGHVSADNARAFASNIVTNHTKDYKDNDRSMFEVATGINNNNVTFGDERHGYVTTNEYLSGVTHNVDENGVDTAVDGRLRLMTRAKAETMANMDDAAFAEAFLGLNQRYINQDRVNTNAIDFGAATPEEVRAIAENADDALHKSTNLDPNRRAMLERIVDLAVQRNVGFVPRDQNVQNVQIIGGNNGGGAGGGNA